VAACPGVEIGSYAYTLPVIRLAAPRLGHLVMATLVAACGGNAAAPAEVDLVPTSVPTVISSDVTLSTSVPTATSSDVTLTVDRDTPGRFYSFRTGDTYKVYVDLPASYDDSLSTQFPVVYVLDADWYFDGSHQRLPGGVVDIVESLVLAGDLPEVVLVGVGYTGTNERGRDFISTPRAFHSFLIGELIPAIDERFRTDPSSRTLVGHSDGAFAAIHAFLRFADQADLIFHKYVAVSGDYGKRGLIWDAEERLNRRLAGDGFTATVFLAVGELDEDHFVSTNQQLHETLEVRAYEGLELIHRVYGAYHHGDLVGRAFKDGLRWVFTDWGL